MPMLSILTVAPGKRQLIRQRIPRGEVISAEDCVCEMANRRTGAPRANVAAAAQTWPDWLRCSE
jgi:hypothetical protein